MSTKPSSLERAIRAEAAAATFGPSSDAQQLDAFRDVDGRLPSNIFQIQRKAGPGRTPGSKNKRNDVLAKLVTQQHGDPVLFMASIYSRPIDQAVELMLIADSTAEREQRLYDLVDRCEAMVKSLMLRHDLTPERFDKLTALLDRILDAAQALKSKPGDLVAKVVALQLQAAKAVAEYVHSKKPVEVNAQVGFDATLLMVAPQMGSGGPVEQVMGNIQRAINEGTVEPSQLHDLRVIDGEFTVADGPDDDDDGDDEREADEDGPDFV